MGFGPPLEVGGLPGLTFQGTWNADTNTPTLADGVGDKGDYFVVSADGATSLDGITDWKVGDWATFNGTIWEKVDNTDLDTTIDRFTFVVGTGVAATDRANIAAALARLGALSATSRGEIHLYDDFKLDGTEWGALDNVTVRSFGATFDQDGSNATAIIRGTNCDFVGTLGTQVTSTSGTSTGGFFNGRDIKGLQVVSWTGVLINDSVAGDVTNVSFLNLSGIFAPSTSVRRHNLKFLDNVDIAGGQTSVFINRGLNVTLSGVQAAAEIITQSTGNTFATLSGHGTRLVWSVNGVMFITATGNSTRVRATSEGRLDRVTVSGIGGEFDILCATLSGGGVLFDIGASSRASFIVRSTDAGGVAQTLALGTDNGLVFNWATVLATTIGTATDDSVGSTLDYTAPGDGTVTAVTVVGDATKGVRNCDLTLRLTAAGSSATIEDLVEGCKIVVFSDTLPIVESVAATKNQITHHHITTGVVTELGLTSGYKKEYHVAVGGDLVVGVDKGLFTPPFPITGAVLVKCTARVNTAASGAGAACTIQVHEFNEAGAEQGTQVLTADLVLGTALFATTTSFDRSSSVATNFYQVEVVAAAGATTIPANLQITLEFEAEVRR